MIVHQTDHHKGYVNFLDLIKFHHLEFFFLQTASWWVSVGVCCID